MHEGTQLGEFLKILHWSPERLAREINRRYGKGTVSLKAPYAWAKGAFPRGQVPDFVATILSEHLGRTIIISQIWPQRFPATQPGGIDDPGLGPPWAAEHVDRVLGPLVEQDGHADGTAQQPDEPVPGSVLVSLAVDWLTTDSGPVSARGEGIELPAEILDVLLDRIARLRWLSAAQDSALVMNWVVHELGWALHLTRNAAYDTLLGQRLYGAVAELAQLAGWLAEDRGQYVRGQRYLLGALRASDLGGDRSLGACILSCLGDHLTRCGNEREARRLVKLVDFGMAEAVPCPARSPLAAREVRLHKQLDEGSALLESTAAVCGGPGSRARGAPPAAYWARTVSAPGVREPAGPASRSLTPGQFRYRAS